MDSSEEEKSRLQREFSKALIDLSRISDEVVEALGNIATEEGPSLNDDLGFSGAIGEMTLAVTRKMDLVNNAVTDVFVIDKAKSAKHDDIPHDSSKVSVVIAEDQDTTKPKIGDTRRLESPVSLNNTDRSNTEPINTQTIPNSESLRDAKKSESKNADDIRLKIYYFFSDRDSSKSVISQIFERSAEEKSTLTRNNIITRISRYLGIDKNKLKHGYLKNFYQGLEALEDDFLVRDHRPAQGEEKARICYYLKTPTSEQS